MPDYCFDQLYKTPTHCMVKHEELDQKNFEQIIQFMERIFSFHHNCVSPIIFSPSMNIVVVILSNDKANMKLTINAMYAQDGRIIIYTSNGFEIFDGPILSIPTRSLKTILSQLFG